VWRDGQKKKVFVYRFLSTGTIEEKARMPGCAPFHTRISRAPLFHVAPQVYQRQLSKEGLQNLVDAKVRPTWLNLGVCIRRAVSDAPSCACVSQGKIDMAMMGKEDLRKLFTLRACSSDTHEFLNCKRCPRKPPPATPEEMEQDEEATEQETAAAAQAKGASVWGSWHRARICARHPISFPSFPYFPTPTTQSLSLYPHSTIIAIRNTSPAGQAEKILSATGGAQSAQRRRRAWFVCSAPSFSHLNTHTQSKWPCRPLTPRCLPLGRR